MDEKTSDRIAIVGVSPRNGFFTETNISFMLQQTLHHYSRAVVMVADIPAVSNWLALGYEEIVARRKARLDGNTYKNRTLRAAAQNGFGPDRLSILNWKEQVESNANYKENYRDVRRLYETNEAFRSAANEVTGAMLAHAKENWNHKTHKIKNMAQATETAVHYLLAEIAFLEAAPKIFGNEGADFIYHHQLPLFDRYRSGEFDGLQRPGFGLRVFSPNP